MSYKVLKGKLVVKGDASIDAGDASDGALKLPNKTVDAISEIKSDVRVNNEGELSSTGDRLVQEAALANVKSSMESGDAALQAGLSAEEARAQAAEAVLTSDLATETANRMAAETVIEGLIDAEEAARIAGDAALQGQINDILSNTDPSCSRLTY